MAKWRFMLPLANTPLPPLPHFFLFSFWAFFSFFFFLFSFFFFLLLPLLLCCKHYPPINDNDKKHNEEGKEFLLVFALNYHIKCCSRLHGNVTTTNVRTPCGHVPFFFPPNHQKLTRSSKFLAMEKLWQNYFQKL